MDVTDVIHPDNKSMAERSILALGLDVGGVDFITTDITRSYRDVGGGICECNAAPGFECTWRHRRVSPATSPSRSSICCSRKVAQPHTDRGNYRYQWQDHDLAYAQPYLQDGRIHRGYDQHRWLYIDGRLTVAGDMTGPTAAQMVLRDPSVDAAVMETARGGLLRSGLGYRTSNVSACLNVAADHLGIKGVETVEDLAEIKRVVVEVAQDAAVLNADDPLCLQMADYCKAEKLCYVTMNRNHPLVREHIKAGGTALVLEHGINGNMITSTMRTVTIYRCSGTPDSGEPGGRALHNVQNAMFAAAIAYHMDVDLENIRHGLRTFDSTFFQSPGRLNVYDEHPFKVIMDTPTIRRGEDGLRCGRSLRGQRPQDRGYLYARR